jgi:hypothetical protein
VTFHTSKLAAAIADLCASLNEQERAYGHNFNFEERLSPERQGAYESTVRLRETRGKALIVAHGRYVKNQVKVDRSTIAAPFHRDNSGALILRLHPNQWLIRVEDIGSLIEKKIFSFSYEELENILRVCHSGPENPGDKKQQDANARLARCIEVWNTVWRDGRPSFATFLDDLHADVEAENWPERLRDQLGLGHYNVEKGAEPRLVALMKYRVSNVLNTLNDHPDQKSCAFSAPTVLDSECTGYFFPSPGPSQATDVSFGRTVDLVSVAPDRRLVCEILHRPFPYRPEHLVKIGKIAKPIPNYRLWEIRNAHLHRLRRQTGRSDLGEEMTGDVRA